MPRFPSAALAAVACLSMVSMVACAVSSQAPPGGGGIDFDSGAVDFDGGQDATMMGTDAAEEAPGTDGTVPESAAETGADSAAGEASAESGTLDAAPDVKATEAGAEAGPEAGQPEAGPDAMSDARPMCVDPTIDCPASLTLCKIPICSAGVCATQNAAAGATCTDQGGNICAAAGYCESSCLDGVQDATETDVDCGGPYCDAAYKTCADGKKCVAGADCFDKVCTGNVCQAATCSDGVQNGGETGVDCGGPCTALTKPQTCPAGDNCFTASDCTSGYCFNNTTCALRPNGVQCWNGAASCLSGYCANIPGNQICCDSACNGTCQTCGGGYPGLTYGNCGQVPAGQGPPPGQCASNGTCGNDGLCNAAGACEQQPTTVNCGPTCVGVTLTSPGFCDGKGGCGGVQSSCSPYACSSFVPACNTTCSKAADCAPGFNCVGTICM